MPVCHRGCMSKHPAWVKIAILEFLEARLQDAAEDLGIGANKVQVYDPFTTENDFYIIVDASWYDYLKIYAWYYDEGNKGSRQINLEKVDPGPDILTRYGAKYTTRIRKAIYDYGPDAPENELFNASTSKTEIFYTIGQMKRILQNQIPIPEE